MLEEELDSRLRGNDSEKGTYPIRLTVVDDLQVTQG